jgi:uncharacterized membrane protein
MRNRLVAGAMALAIIAMTAVSVVVVLSLPPDTRVPLHFGFDGQPDRWGHPGFGLFILPVVAAGVWVLFAALPALQKAAGKPLSPLNAVGLSWIAVTWMLLAAHATMIAVALGFSFDVTRAFAAAFGVMLVLLGVAMRDVRPNRVLGVRTPWTLGDDRVWEATHRFASRLLLACGVVLSALSFVVPPGWPAPVITAALIVIVVLPVGKSYLLSRSGRPSL